MLGVDFGGYGIGSTLTGPVLAAKLGIGFRRENFALAVVGEGDYGIANLPVRDAKGNWRGNYWLLPQLDVAYLEDGMRLHAFVGGGWGRFLQADGVRQADAGLFGFGFGLGWGAFDATVRWLWPVSGLTTAGPGLAREPVPGIGAQLMAGFRFDMMP